MHQCLLVVGGSDQGLAVVLPPRRWFFPERQPSPRCHCRCARRCDVARKRIIPASSHIGHDIVPILKAQALHGTICGPVKLHTGGGARHEAQEPSRYQECTAQCVPLQSAHATPCAERDSCLGSRSHTAPLPCATCLIAANASPLLLGGTIQGCRAPAGRRPAPLLTPRFTTSTLGCRCATLFASDSGRSALQSTGCEHSPRRQRSSGAPGPAGQGKRGRGSRPGPGRDVGMGAATVAALETPATHPQASARRPRPVPGVGAPTWREPCVAVHGQAPGIVV